jgi:quercetin dioxygenase-like cupin family protein
MIAANVRIDRMLIVDLADVDLTAQNCLMKKILILGSFIFAAAIVALTAQEKTGTTTEHKVVAPNDLKWGDAPAGLPPGAKLAVLDGDPGKPGPFIVRLKAPAGYKVPPHTHPTDERLTVISGSFKIGMGDKFDEASMQEMGPGSFVALSMGMKHFATSTTESIVQINSEGPFQINYVNPNDDPRNAKK